MNVQSVISTLKSEEHNTEDLTTETALNAARKVLEHLSAQWGKGDVTAYAALFNSGSGIEP